MVGVAHVGLPDGSIGLKAGFDQKTICVPIIIHAKHGFSCPFFSTFQAKMVIGLGGQVAGAGTGFYNGLSEFDTSGNSRSAHFFNG